MLGFEPIHLKTCLRVCCIGLRGGCASGRGRGGGETVGAVDLGGSSLEVSFVPDEPFSSESQGLPALHALVSNNNNKIYAFQLM